MKKHRFAVTLLTLTAMIFSFVACDDDFATLESDVINNEIATNFEILNDTYDIITYTHSAAPEPVQSDGLQTLGLGLYNDAYGETNTSILTQLSLTTEAPDFSDLTKVDSVIFYIPYFINSVEIDEDGDFIYETDSVFGINDQSQMKFSLYESDYFLRDFDPNEDFDTPQAYYSNKTGSSISEDLSGSLMGTPISFVRDEGTSYPNGNADNVIQISKNGFTLTNEDDDPTTDTQIIQQQTPGIRIKLDTIYWKNKLLDMDVVDPNNISTQDNFNNYFRGLFMKAELPNSGQRSYAIFNLANASSNITIYYKRFTPTTSDDEDVTESATYTLGFGPTRINFFDNNFVLQPSTPNSTTGDSRLFLKGGEGYTARIKLFNGENPDDDIATNNIFEAWKSQFVETDADGELVVKRLVNEANLVFYVDQDIITDNEPDRLYIYDTENNIPLLDYFRDETNNTIPTSSKINHLVPLQNEEKYKIRITNHINNLLLNDSTNVELGLSVSLNVNTENPVQNFIQRRLQDTDPQEFSPTSSVMSPRGTVLHGNNTEDETKKVYLEIYYTCLNTDEECIDGNN